MTTSAMTTAVPVSHSPGATGVSSKFKITQKMENSRGVTVNLTGNPGVQLQKNRYPQHFTF